MEYGPPDVIVFTMRWWSSHHCFNLTNYSQKCQCLYP